MITAGMRGVPDRLLHLKMRTSFSLAAGEAAGRLVDEAFGGMELLIFNGEYEVLVAIDAMKQFIFEMHGYLPGLFSWLNLGSSNA